MVYEPKCPECKSDLLKKVETNDDIKQFGKLKVELIKYHQQYANHLGLQDEIVEKYSYEDAVRNVGKPDYCQFLIMDKDNPIGIMEYQFVDSDIDSTKILYLKNMYVKASKRGKGVGTQIITELKKLGYRIELKCWYGMPSNRMYRNLGAKEVKTHYMLT